jgi:hypothetical protein
MGAQRHLNEPRNNACDKGISRKRERDFGVEFESSSSGSMGALRESLGVFTPTRLRSLCRAVGRRAWAALAAANDIGEDGVVLEEEGSFSVAYVLVNCRFECLTRMCEGEMELSRLETRRNVPCR